MQTLGGSCHDLMVLASGQGPQGPGAPRARADPGKMIFVSNQLPIRMRQAGEEESGAVCGWVFEWDEDAVLAQAKTALDDENLQDLEPVYVGALAVELDIECQEAVSRHLYDRYRCLAVFIGDELRHRHYNQLCKLQLWPMLHYVLPMNPHGAGRFDASLWQACIKANKMYGDRLMEVLNVETDFVWIHDYHLMVLPALLRKRFHRVKCGFFLHSPFPSSEIFRVFPRRDDLLRCLLSADVVGFHTFDYARHFLSCCSRLLGLEHRAHRGSIIVEYYGRSVSVKILPIGIQPARLLAAMRTEGCRARAETLRRSFGDEVKVMLGVDDTDVFKGIELKLQAFECLLQAHSEWIGRVTLLQVLYPARSASKDVDDVAQLVDDIAARINDKHGSESYTPVVLLKRKLPLEEKLAMYSIADVAVVTATRDGMNLLPYEYLTAREGMGRALAEENRGAEGEGPTRNPDDSHAEGHSQAEQNLPPIESTLVVSEFVGCSPSLSGAIRVNPWSVEAVAEGMFNALKLPERERRLRHAKHWKYVSNHTVTFWARNYIDELRRFTAGHGTMRCYGLGLGLDTFRMIALSDKFQRLDTQMVYNSYHQAAKRLILLDYDGTLVSHNAINPAPNDELLHVLRELCQDERNSIYIVSGRRRAHLAAWFQKVPRLGIAAEHGYWLRVAGQPEFECRAPDLDLTWQEAVGPIIRSYTESTDGSHMERKESAIVWNYRNADPDFGSWQAKELTDHLESVLSNQAVQVVSGSCIVEVKPVGMSKGQVAELLLGAGKGADFVMCCGDDRSDEEMFSAMEHIPGLDAEIIACTVGQKPSKAPYYVEDPAEVVDVLRRCLEAPGADVH
ncbi:unnamed protein product [Pedinophyceae sp. YPF-701]|nr:unnamed protein product [Pedinophyceae sp. YPF-701]